MISYYRNLTPFIFLILANLLASIRSQTFCLNNGNYTNNSTYQANIDNNGFYNASLGRNPDRVNAIAFCRGDTQLDFCRSCVQNATTDLVLACPNYRQGIIRLAWYSQFCNLRYSNASILGTLDDQVLQAYYNGQTATNPDRFMSDLRTLVDDIRVRASNGGSLRKVAAGNTTTPGFYRTIYGMAQCTPDLSRQDCDSCLSTAISNFIGCCYAAIGGGVDTPSCFVRYEVGRFVNETRLQELDPIVPSPPVPMPSPPPPP